jgi:hypothetical protein
MHHPFRTTLASLVLLTWQTASAFAWNFAGHQVSGAIAYQVLQKESPGTVAKVVAVLKQLPDFEKTWGKKLEAVPEADRDELLFMLATRWADDIRGQPKFDHPKWHYINFPYKPDGQPDSVQAPAPDAVNILEGFQVNLRIAKGEGEGENRAVALCWLFHLVGDVHQPLHTVGLFTTDYPKGDRGGNLIFVRAAEGGQPINLHFLWDGLILGSQNTRTAHNLAIKLLARPELARDKLSELKEPEFEQWAKAESFTLAKDLAYLSGKIPGSLDRDAAPVLPEGYLKRAKEIAERRIVLTGYRLAEVMKSTVK